jgi:hypothetical protein
MARMEERATTVATLLSLSRRERVGAVLRAGAAIREGEARDQRRVSTDYIRCLGGDGCRLSVEDARSPRVDNAEPECLTCGSPRAAFRCPRVLPGDAEASAKRPLVGGCAIPGEA